MRLNFDRQTFTKNLRYDFPASIVVFLVALPLCLGIALASDAPLFSGILTGIIGGIIVGLLSGSQVSVTGPAAGLTVIVASGIQSLGSFEAFLCAVCLAGVFQILFWTLRAGFLASLFPNAVIKGMLAAIGITIILKQVPHAFGGFGQFESDMEFWNLFGNDATADALWKALTSLKLSAFVICFLSLLLVVAWDSPKIKARPFLSRIPGPLVAVTFAAVINQVFEMRFPSLALRAEDGHLVRLPEITSFMSLISELRFPDFSALTRGATWIVGLTLAAVASIETLLCIESTDKLDPQRRVSDTNRELLAQGAGNLLAGLVGGLPMTSVIVRSSANIYAGAKSRVSTILHGTILFGSAMFLGSILNLIPLAALAAVLISVGYKLAHPKLFRRMWNEGHDQFLPFLITITAVMFTDLLRGVLIGLLVGIAFVIRASYYSAILVVHDSKDTLIRFTKDVTFIHKIRLRRELAKIPKNSRVLVDGSRAMYIDHDALEMIQDFVETAPDKGIVVELREVVRQKELSPITNWRNEPHGIVQEATTR